MRLDVFLSESGKFDSRTKAAQAIGRGEVLVNGRRAKAGEEVDGNSRVEILSARRYVSNGGYKLERALDVFGYSPEGKIFADIGASTGGFTDVLLRRGAKKVYAVDVGENQLHPSLKGDERVVVMDRTNARNLTSDSFSEMPDGFVVDCSFISLKLILPAIAAQCPPEADIIALIKPQFECEEKISFKNGVVKDRKIRARIVKSLYDFCIGRGFFVHGFTNAPLLSGKNVEYLILLSRRAEGAIGERALFDTLI